MGRGPSIVFASRELWPFVGGGIGRSVWGAARLLADHAEVTILTAERWRPEYQKLRDAGDPRLPAGVRFTFAPEPEGDLSPYVSSQQAWSAELLASIATLYPNGGPDVVEVADYGGEGFALAHARRAGDPRLSQTVLAVRLHTSAEICAELNEATADLNLRLLAGIERFPLAYGDVLLEPGGDVLQQYAARYGEEGLAPAIRCPPPATAELVDSDPAEMVPELNGPLRILYLNRLERRKGVEELLTAVRSLPSADLTLTLVGGDTDSAPGGGSMLEHCKCIVAGDTRVAFRDGVPHEEVAGLIASHHLVVVPTRWETFSYVTREALAANRPVVATAAGAIVEVIEPGESGWLVESSSPEDIRVALEGVLASRDDLDRMIRSGLPRARFEKSDNSEELLAAYLGLAERAPSQAPTHDGKPAGATAIVAAEPEGPAVTRTLRSLRNQAGARVETVLVSTLDHSPRATDLGLVDRLVSCETPGANRIEAWMAGMAAAAHDLLVLVPSGTELEPDFIARTSAALRASPGFAYATAFVAGGHEPWHAPAGNYRMPTELDLAASVALIRGAALAELMSAEELPPDESSMFAALARHNRIGVVVQEPLVTRLPRRSGVLAVAV